ncbi:hypothetical protein ABGV17_05885 [Guyparkeria sp. GHLCS8-2]|uniref:hypothetical protein n=1 Tax=Guyparkeria halopsychrophila TaxID=3139421 RepID=UPI0037C97849
MIDLDTLTPPQRTVARLLGIPARRLRQLQASGKVAPPGSTLGDQVRGYTAYLRRAEERARSRRWR